MQKDPVRMALLLDLYGPLLTERQREAAHLHFEEDLSLGEMAENLGVSRQAVHDTLQRAQAALEELESRLGFLQRLARLDQLAGRLDAALTALERDTGHGGQGTRHGLHPVRAALDELLRELRR